MSANTRRIESEEQYQKSLSWLVNTAIELSDPLLDEATKAKKMRQYDFVADGVQRYKRGQLAQLYPGLRQVYQSLGWAFDDPVEQDHPPQKPQQTQPVTVPEPKPEPPKQEQQSDLYSWLYDDDDDDD